MLDWWRVGIKKWSEALRMGHLQLLLSECVRWHASTLPKLTCRSYSRVSEWGRYARRGKRGVASNRATAGLSVPAIKFLERRISLTCRVGVATAGRYGGLGPVLGNSCLDILER